MRVLTIVLDYMSFLPPAFLCFLPMKDQLRYSLQRTAATVGAVMVGAMLLLGSIQFHFSLESNYVLLPMLAVCFFVYKKCQKATLWQSRVWKTMFTFSGIGISSVVSTAESYGGVALFSHQGIEFYSNVAIPLV